MAFKPIDALLGGALIGTGTGMFMMLSKRIAGNSGILKALIVGPRDAKVAYIGGLLLSGILLNLAAPHLFGMSSGVLTLTPALWGIVIGVGTTLANGCTSGHGLCGLSRLSSRSIAAVPVFMASGIVTSTITVSLTMDLHHLGSPAPAVSIDPRTLHVVLVTVGALMLALVPTLWLWSAAKKAGKESPIVAVWCGLCSGAGLAIGGMVRPSVVQAALAPYRIDFTLWVLFTTALATTFVLYRVASRCLGVAEAACTSGATSSGVPSGHVDAKLVVGAALFGVGWGATGLCPGPLLVLVAAQPSNPDAVLCLLGVIFGTLVAASKKTGWLFRLQVWPSPSTSVVPLTTATREKVEAALRAGAIVVDVRAAVSSEATDGAFRTLKGAFSALWDVDTKSLALGALPGDVSTPLVLICRTGRRAGAAAAFLAAKGYTRVLNGGGPRGAAEPWQALVAHCGALNVSFSGGGLRQLFDGAAPAGGGSSTNTYILTDDATRQAIIIDPVREHAERDMAAVRGMGCTLTYALNTHCHADHVTGTGRLKELAPSVQSYISRASGALADVLLDDKQTFKWAGGNRALTVLATPGHTNGCVSYYDADAGIVFTGDTLLIDGCGRTDFQEGDAATLYDSVHSQLFTLPAETLLLPAHDYRGRSFSTIGAQRATNVRLTKPKPQFVELMAGLGLPYPKKMDIAVPANQRCGAEVMV